MPIPTALAGPRQPRPTHAPTFVTPEPDYSGWALAIAMIVGLYFLFRYAYFR